MTSYMKSIFTAIWLSATLTVTASAQEDETDISRYKVVGDEGNLPTVTEFASLEDEVRALREDGNCNELTIKAAEAARIANLLANVISQGLEPFYGANSDDRSRISRELGPSLNLLADAETTATNLRLIRNEFWVFEATCLLEMGERDDGMNKMYRALDFIVPLEQQALWDEAREALWATVGYN